MQTALHGSDARDGLHVIVHQCQNRIEVAPVDGVNDPVVQIFAPLAVSRYRRVAAK